MTDKELAQLGIASPAAVAAVRRCLQHAAQAGISPKQLRKLIRAVANRPEKHRTHALFAPLAEALHNDGGANTAAVLRHAKAEEEELHGPSLHPGGGAPWRKWGRNLDDNAVKQMEAACSLAVSVRGALMPDAHVGYGLPIGGVLAARNAVIPYAVGVDIACRMRMTVLDLPVSALDRNIEQLRRAIEDETRFGVGATFQRRREHAVMDGDWTVSPVTRSHRDKAWAQLGTSGSGNHFVEFGSLEVLDADAGLEPGTYVALLSHSGSRGTGAAVCEHYSRIARDRRRGLPDAVRYLAWLDLDSGEGREYWDAMELMGAYAAANHALIHKHITKHLGAHPLLEVENHHNFAWKEVHDGEEVVVHRKGATPAGRGVTGIIPGSMAAPGYLVRGLGNPESLNSASHGAGRVMSRNKARESFRWHDAKALLEERRVIVMSAGVDELPMVYKDIGEVMAAQTDLVEALARFQPRLVKMAPAGEKPED